MTDTYNKNAHRPSRQRLEEMKRWEHARRIGEQAATQVLGNDPEEVSDFASQFVFEVMQKPAFREGAWRSAAEMDAALQPEAERFVRGEFQRRRRHRKKVPNFTSMEGDHAVVYDIIDRRPGPETLAIFSDLFYWILSEIDTEKPTSQHVFWKHVLDDKRLTELAEETGQTANTLGHTLSRIRKRLKEHLAGDGLTQEEINAFLNELDRLSSG